MINPVEIKIGSKTVRGDQVNIQGLDCHLPPVGFVFNVLTGQVEERQVVSRSQDPSEQFWVREGLPDWWNLKRGHEKQMQKTDPEYFDPDCELFRTQAWDRRLNGMWFMNNGVPTYITGLHYFYLDWIYIGGSTMYNGYPDYWRSDKEFFYFLDYCIEDDLCLGCLYVTKRREGKTKKSVAFLLDAPTRMIEANVGIQSKTLEDARDVVFGATVEAFKRLPDFFVPVYDTSATMKTSLDFRYQIQKGKNQTMFNADDALNSSVTWKSSVETAYDGKKLKRYVGDEIFKTVDVDVRRRNDIVAWCLKDYNSNIDGKALYTSTVEDISGNLEAYKKFWHDSDQRKKAPLTGRTKTGLYSYMLPSNQARNRDKYGNCDEEKNYNDIINGRAMLMDDLDLYLAEMKREPLTIEEVFRSAKKDSLFDTIKLVNRLDRLSFSESNYETGTFEWEIKDGQPDKVVWRPKKTGQVNVYYMPDESNQNAVKKTGSLFYPLNGHRFIIGVDPYDHNTTVGKGSKGACYVFKKYDALNPDYSESFIVEYVHRPATAALFYEQVLKIAHFYGALILYEDNKPGIKTYFENKGYLPFLLKLPGRQEPGIPATAKSHQQIAEYTEAYIYEHIDKVVFPALIQDWLNFDLSNTEKFDRSMAAGYTLIANERIVQRQSTPQRDISDFFRKRKQ